VTTEAPARRDATPPTKSAVPKTAAAARAKAMLT
jgi:hypothetical protein